MRSVPGYVHLSNEELLRHIETVDAKTPLEQELACRLRLVLDMFGELFIAQAELEGFWYTKYEGKAQGSYV